MTKKDEEEQINDHILFSFDRNDPEFEKLYYLDYMTFAVMSRYNCAKSLYDSFTKETDDLRKRAFALGVWHQRFMAIEDSLHICTTLRTMNIPNSKLRFHEGIARKFQNKDVKATKECMSNKTFLIEIGLPKKPNIKHYKKLGLTNTVLKKQWVGLRDAFYKTVEKFEDFNEDYNKVKHGNAVISGLGNIAACQDRLKEYICTIVTTKDGKKYSTSLCSSIKEKVVKAHLDDTFNITSNMFTLLYMSAIQHWRDDKDFVEKLKAKLDYYLENYPETNK